MGEVALDSADDEVVTEVTEDQVEGQVEDSEKPEAEEPEEIEIVNSNDDGSQPVDSNLGIRKRINKLNTKVEVAKEEASAVSSELAIERQKNELLQLALEQQKAKPEAVKPPDPMDFDDGASDAKYITSLNQYNQSFIQAELQKHVAANKPAPQVDHELERLQKAHYDRAEKLGVTDYDEVEDKAIDILGNDIVNQFIKASPDSQTVLYYLGKNPGKAEEIAKLIKSEPIKGVLKLGALGAGLKVQTKARKSAPDPDNELEGSVPAAKGRRGPKGAKFE